MKANILLLIFFIFFATLYFWHLGSFSLTSWDEAWYGAVSKNILHQKNWLLLYFNGEPFWDHPPFGFWLQALSQLLLGENEFAVRLPSVIWGLLTLIFTYKIGKKLGGELTGLLALIILATCPWFVLRLRSGNLDTILLGNMLGSLFFTIKTKENYIYSPLMSFFILLTILTKSLLGLGIFILCFYWLWPFKKTLFFKRFLNLGFIFLILFLWALLIQSFSNINPLIKMWNVGTRGGLEDLWGFQYFRKNLFYLHMGVEKWYYPMILSLVLSCFFLKKKEIKLLWLWLIIYLFIFLFNRKTELWHLLPAYPSLALVVGLVINKFKQLRIFLFVFIFLIFLKQVDRVIILIKEQKGVSKEAILAKEIKNIRGKFYFDGEEIPVVVYYSNKKVYPLKYNFPPYNRIDYVLKYGEEGALVMTATDNLKKLEREWREIKRIDDQSLIVLGTIH